ncbi:MAG: energy-coupling factor ABC transporter ATP-binding protein [Chloroflexi bacterium]|nr:energy-coupling factor ABC transporter ATP-binding protein [Chloroflexota bacterium]
MGVSYRYAGGSRPSLLDLDLKLPDGQIVGLAGASESGKSTLCLVLSGLAPRAIRGACTGTLLVDGEDGTAWPMHRMAEAVGTSFQDPLTQLSGVTATVFEEVCFGPMNLGMPRDDVIGHTWAALETLGIETLAPRDPSTLSGGQMQLVAIAGLLAMQPRHLVLDEPTAQLDPAGTALVGEALARLAARGTSILIAEQKTDLLSRICGRVLVLDSGRVVLDGPAAEVLGDPRLDELGVPVPSAIRLRRAIDAAGLMLDIPADLVA